MAGKLYVVGTPIGNLGDITHRAARTLEEVDFIAAEDTRVTLKLLNYLEIRKPLVSYHQHSSRQVAENIIERILAGENCAVVTDAGMPCVSDPGEDLVAECARQGIEILVVPGPVAGVSALAISGLPTSRFCFEGFLSTAKKQRYEHLTQLRNERRTMIFYEAPHKLIDTLKDMSDYFGEDRRISLCRELTKIHEEVIRTTLGAAKELYSEKSPRGEYVLIIEGAAEPTEPEMTLEAAAEMVRALIEEGMKPTDACRNIAKQTGFKKGELYREIAGE